MAALTLRHLGLDLGLVEYIQDRQVNDRRYLMDTAKIRSLGWKPTIGIEEGLSQTTEWYKNMGVWWEPILARS